MSSRLENELFEPFQHSSGYRISAIIELSQLTTEKRDFLLSSFTDQAGPLLQQSEFANLRLDSAWLFSAKPDSTLQAQQRFQSTLAHHAGSAVCGWIISRLQHPRLLHHLSQANNVNAPDGRGHLLRHYTEDAVRTLHARRDLPGVCQWLMPIHSWWIPVARLPGRTWERMPGFDRPDRLTDYSLELDCACWTELLGDPLCTSLADQLTASWATAGLTEIPRERRVAMVRHALAQARKEGLVHHHDLITYATGIASFGEAIASTPIWQAALTATREKLCPFAEALGACQKTEPAQGLAV